MSCKCILMTESILEAMRRIKKMLKVRTEYTFLDGTKYADGEHTEVVLVEEEGTFWIFEDAMDAAEYLGSREQANGLERFQSEEAIEGYAIWHYTSDRRYDRHPILKEKYRPVRFTKEDSGYMRKEMSLVGAAVISWSVD